MEDMASEVRNSAISQAIIQIGMAPSKVFADALSLDMSEAAWLVGMFSAIIANFGLSLIENPLARKVYSSVISLCFGFFIGGLGFIPVLASMVIVWVVMVTLPRKQARLVGDIVNWGFLTAVNLYCWWINYGRRDICLREYSMQSFIRSNMTLANYSDAGLLKDKETSKTMSSRERHYAEGLEEVPSFGNWMAYHLALFHCTGTGPALEYRDTMEFYDKTSDVRKMKTFSNIPSVLRRFGEVLLMIVFFVIITGNHDQD